MQSTFNKSIPHTVLDDGENKTRIAIQTLTQIIVKHDVWSPWWEIGSTGYESMDFKYVVLE